MRTLTFHIRDNATGHVREHRDDYEDSSAVEYLWTDGNFGCDCNRHLFFCRAGGEEASEDVECGTERYSLVKVETKDGADLTAAFVSVLERAQKRA